MDKIKITKDMKFGLIDLMNYIDVDHEFTLRDILIACKDSSIPMETLGELLQCPYIEEYYNEMDKGKEGDRDMLHLELGYGIEQDDEDPFICHGWSFYGVGEEGYISQDIIDHYSEEEVQKMRDEGYRETYAVELSPIYELADYPIKINNEIDVTVYNDTPVKQQPLKGKPEIRLMEVLYEIFWELSFMGSTTDRDEAKDNLCKRIDEYEQAKGDGTLEYIDFEEVKDKLTKKYDKDI